MLSLTLGLLSDFIGLFLIDSAQIKSRKHTLSYMCSQILDTLSTVPCSPQLVFQCSWEEVTPTTQIHYIIQMSQVLNSKCKLPVASVSRVLSDGSTCANVV